MPGYTYPTATPASVRVWDASRRRSRTMR
jgi:hypothetical protein